MVTTTGPEATPRRVEILYFAGCPHVDLARDRVAEAVRVTGVAAEVVLVEVLQPDDALRLRFPGSPTIRVDGRDVEEGDDARAIGWQCRVYSVAGRLDGAPPASWIAASLRPQKVAACCSKDLVSAPSEQPSLVCRPDALSKDERARSKSLRDRLSAATDDTSELADGYAFRYPADPSLFRAAAEWIVLERRCCPFLAFELGWQPGDDGRPCLMIRGPEGTKAFLAAEMPALPLT